MPDWQPNWEDVDFDHAAAQAAVDECRLSAGALDTAFTGVATAEATLDTDGAWAGPYRFDFDAAQPAMMTDAGDTAGALRRLANDIATAAVQAGAEQEQRERDRERWWAEKAVEDQQRAQQPPGRNIPV
jgi:hypothetical protein